MPGMSGLYLQQELKRRGLGIPIVFTRMRISARTSSHRELWSV